MKRILFLSKSRLSQNLMELVIPSIPKKVVLTGSIDLNSLAGAYLPKPFNLVMIDENILENGGIDTLSTLFEASAFRHAKRVAICHKNSRLNREAAAAVGIAYFHTKPFLAEELAGIIERYLGTKK